MGPAGRKNTKLNAHVPHVHPLLLIIIGIRITVIVIGRVLVIVLVIVIVIAIVFVFVILVISSNTWAGRKKTTKEEQDKS